MEQRPAEPSPTKRYEEPGRPRASPLPFRAIADVAVNVDSMDELLRGVASSEGWHRSWSGRVI